MKQVKYIQIKAPTRSIEVAFVLIAISFNLILVPLNVIGGVLKKDHKRSMRNRNSNWS